MTDRKCRKALIQHKRKQRDGLIRDIILVASLAIVEISFPVMALIYILQAGPI